MDVPLLITILQPFAPSAPCPVFLIQLSITAQACFTFPCPGSPYPPSSVSRPRAMFMPRLFGWLPRPTKSTMSFPPLPFFLSSLLSGYLLQASFFRGSFQRTRTEHCPGSKSDPSQPIFSFPDSSRLFCRRPLAPPSTAIPNCLSILTGIG